MIRLRFMPIPVIEDIISAGRGGGWLHSYSLHVLVFGSKNLLRFYKKVYNKNELSRLYQRHFLPFSCFKHECDILQLIIFF